MVLNSVFCALYLRGAPRQAWVSRSRAAAVESALRREECSLSSAAGVLRGAGLSAEATALEAPGLLAWAEERIERQEVITPFCDAYPRGWRVRLGDAKPLAAWIVAWPACPLSATSMAPGLAALALGEPGLGAPGLEVNPRLAIVGSRDPTASGREFCFEVAAEAARQGWSVVSGGARGCDSAARAGALSIFEASASEASAFEAPLSAAGASPIGFFEVLPHGLAWAGFGARSGGSDSPSGRAEYCWEIPSLESICGVTHLSVCAPHEPFSRAAAMERNLLIYAMADATLAVEPRFKEGGTWWGAVEALRRGLGPLWVAGESAACGTPGSHPPARSSSPLAQARKPNAVRALTALGAHTFCYELASDSAAQALLTEIDSHLSGSGSRFSEVTYGYGRQLALWERYALRQ